LPRRGFFGPGRRGGILAFVKKQAVPTNAGIPANLLEENLKDRDLYSRRQAWPLYGSVHHNSSDRRIGRS
jgi:hypothetical protein